MQHSRRERIGMWLQAKPVLRWLVLGYSHSHKGMPIYLNNLSGHLVREDELY